jgi:hypothetical protein
VNVIRQFFRIISGAEVREAGWAVHKATEELIELQSEFIRHLREQLRLAERLISLYEEFRQLETGKKIGD